MRTLYINPGHDRILKGLESQRTVAMAYKEGHDMPICVVLGRPTLKKGSQAGRISAQSCTCGIIQDKHQFCGTEKPRKDSPFNSRRFGYLSRGSRQINQHVQR